MESICSDLGDYINEIPQVDNLSTGEKGKIGEELARCFLIKHGFIIEEWHGVLDHNCLYDCFARHNGEPYYIEVKTSFKKSYRPRIAKAKRKGLIALRSKGANIWILKIFCYPENPQFKFESFSDFLNRSSATVR